MSFQLKRWAKSFDGLLFVGVQERPLKMVDSDATAEPLFAKNGFGADVIRFPANGKVAMHTHEGDHILLVLAGVGTVTVGNEVYRLSPGYAYFIEGKQPHAIDAETKLVLMAIGNQHFPADSKERLELC